jgi:hypothetical protein
MSSTPEQEQSFLVSAHEKTVVITAKTEVAERIVAMMEQLAPEHREAVLLQPHEVDPDFSRLELTWPTYNDTFRFYTFASQISQLPID